MVLCIVVHIQLSQASAVALKEKEKADSEVAAFRQEIQAYREFAEQQLSSFQTLLDNEESVKAMIEKVREPELLRFRL